MNRAAQSLGRLARGKPKRITPEDRERRRERMRAAQAVRAAAQRAARKVAE